MRAVDEVPVKYISTPEQSAYQTRSKEGMRSKFRFLDPIIAIGISVSVGTAVILVLIGQDSAISLLSGLVITAITLMIDVIARLRESEERILKTSVLGASIVRDPWLLSTIQQIVDDYLAVKDHRFGTFARGAIQALTDCRDVLHGLVEGHMTVGALSQFTFGRSGINEVRNTMKAVQYANPGYWRTKYGERYFQSNVEAIKRGVKITRIWLQDRETLNNYRDIIEAQEKAGIRVLIALLDEVPRGLHEDYLIADDEVLVKLELTLDGHSKAERISVDPIEVQRALANFDLLLRYVSDPSEFFATRSETETKPA